MSSIFHEFLIPQQIAIIQQRKQGILEYKSCGSSEGEQSLPATMIRDIFMEVILRNRVESYNVKETNTHIPSEAGLQI